MSMYKCGKCGREVLLEKDASIRCPFCGYKILFKERSPQIVKKVIAK